jgi:hypothetical protein
MAISSTWCPVLGAHVTRVTDLDGLLTRIICAEYDDTHGSCRLRQAAQSGGPLSRLLERVAEKTFEQHDMLCVLRAI